MGVPAVRLDDLDEPEGRAKSPGEFMWINDGAGKAASLWFVCPCGCGDESAICIAPHGAHPKQWQWDGNRQKPTLTPSIHKQVGCGWHGWLRNGEWVTA